MSSYEIRVPGAPFQEQMALMRLRLIELAEDSLPIPFDLFFDYFRLSGNNGPLATKLIGRGSFRLSAAGRYLNSGPLLDETIYDIGPDRRQITLFLNNIVEAAYSVNGNELRIDFGDGDILIGVDELPPELGYGTSFLLKALSWTDAGARYIAEEDGIPEHGLEIFVDVSLTEAVFLGISANFAGTPSSLLQMVALAPDSAPCCSGFEPQQPPEGPLCINVHAKILVQPSRPVADQIAAMNLVFQSAQVTVHLASTEILNLPSFNDLDIGRCVSNEYTAEQGELYTRYRANAAPKDVCIYWVRSLISNTGNVIGCAAHPPDYPALALIGAAFPTPYLLAHELGHVLGLNHIQNSDNLMNPVDNYTNPPPDLASSQAGTMRWSRLLFPC